MMSLLTLMFKQTCHTSQACACSLHSLTEAVFAAEVDGLLDSETDDELADADADADADVDVHINLPYEPGAHLRPGIVHRLDKGTTGMCLLAWGRHVI